MANHAYHILRLGLGVTFVILGFQILSAPLAWAGFMQPWAQGMIPGDLAQFMKTTAIIDIVIGAWLILGFKVWIPALLGSLHIAGVLLTTTGNLDSLIARDIGLLGGTLALLFDRWPHRR